MKRHHLHADNCARENKNNLMVQYLMCRILNGRQSTVHYFFLIVGHTIISPDWSKAHLVFIQSIKAAILLRRLLNSQQFVMLHRRYATKTDP